MGRRCLFGTDNAVSSGVFNGGTSTSKSLHEITLEVKIKEMEHNAFIHLFHMSGTRMIAVGIDGLSRGDFESGVMTGQSMLRYLPFAKTAIELGGPTLRAWLETWMGPWVEPLTPEGWFTEGHRPGVHVWVPPPAAARHALEELSRAKTKRPWATAHVVLIPRVLYLEEWRRRFHKEVDFWFYLPTGDCWPHSVFEPLVVTISFPLRREEPWQVRRSAAVVALQNTVQGMCQRGDMGFGDRLRQLWSDPWGF